MPCGPLAELLSCVRLAAADLAAVEEFNRRAKEDHRLHPELGPSAFEGDIDEARVVLLLANPGYDAGSTTEDHTFIRTDGRSAALTLTHPRVCASGGRIVCASWLIGSANSTCPRRWRASKSRLGPAQSSRTTFAFQAGPLFCMRHRSAHPEAQLC